MRVNDLIDRLEKAIREHILEAMSDPTGLLADEALPDLLMSFETWRSRRIPARPRSVHRSAELQASPKSDEHERVLDAIIAKIQAGDDLTPHLSKAIDRPETRDRMLADLGIHHLHLSTELQDDGRWVKRGEDVLFVAFKPGDAYLIGVYRHVTDWAREDILATAARNWPDAGIVHELNGQLVSKYDDAARLELQKAGISTGTAEVDGSVFATLGQSLTGEPYSAQRLRMTVMFTLDDWREHLAERLGEAERAVDELAGRKVRGDWEPIVRNGWAGLQRENVFHRIVSLS